MFHDGIVLILLHILVTITLWRRLIICFNWIFYTCDWIVIIVPVFASNLLLVASRYFVPTITLLTLWLLPVVILLNVTLLVTVIAVWWLILILIVLILLWTVHGFSWRLLIGVSPSQGKGTGSTWCLGDTCVRFVSSKVCIIC